MVNLQLFKDPKLNRQIDQDMVDTYVQIIAKTLGRILSEYTKVIVNKDDYFNPKKITKARVRVAEELGNIRESVARDFGRNAKINNIIYQLTEEIHRIEEQFASKISYEHSRYKTQKEALIAYKKVVSEIAALFDDTFSTKEKKRMLDDSGIASAA
jgi:hypothetical protein